MNTPTTPPHSVKDPSARMAIMAWLSGFVGMGLFSLLSTQSVLITLIIGAMGGTCALVLVYPDAPYSNPSVMMGQLFSTILGWLFIHHFGAYWSAPMILLGTVLSCLTVFNAYRISSDMHPIQATIRQHTCWGFLFFPNIFSTIAVIAYATHLNNSVQCNSPQQT